MATRRCPRCKLINPGSAIACDCGWSFVEETMGKPRNIPKPRQHGGGSDGTVDVAAGALLLVIGLVVTFVTFGSASARGGGTYLIAYGPIGVGAGSIIRGLLKRSR